MGSVSHGIGIDGLASGVNDVVGEINSRNLRDNDNYSRNKYRSILWTQPPMETDENNFGPIANKPQPTTDWQTKYDTLLQEKQALQDKYGNIQSQYDSIQNQYDSMQNQYNTLQTRYQNQNNMQQTVDNIYNNQPQYTPQAGLFEIAQNNQLQDPAQIDNVNMQKYYDPSTLREDMMKGMRTEVNQQKEDALEGMKNTMANAGLYRSGLTLENQNDINQNAMDAVAKGYGDAALGVAQLQNDFAKSQAAFDFDTSKYNTDIKNAWDSKNYDYLMQSAAQDQSAVNEARQYNVDIKNQYDQMMFDWAKSQLQKGIEQQRLDQSAHQMNQNQYMGLLDLALRDAEMKARYGEDMGSTPITGSPNPVGYYNASQEPYRRLY